MLPLLLPFLLSRGPPELSLLPSLREDGGGGGGAADGSGGSLDLRLSHFPPPAPFLLGVLVMEPSEPNGRTPPETAPSITFGVAAKCAPAPPVLAGVRDVCWMNRGEFQRLIRRDFMAISPVDIGVPGSLSLVPLLMPRSPVLLPPAPALPPKPIVRESLGVPAIELTLGVEFRGDPGACAECSGSVDAGSVCEKSLRGVVEVTIPPLAAAAAAATAADGVPADGSECTRVCAPFVGALLVTLLTASVLPPLPAELMLLGRAGVSPPACTTPPPWLPLLQPPLLFLSTLTYVASCLAVSEFAISASTVSRVAAGAAR